jgi:hypothetical protein
MRVALVVVGVFGLIGLSHPGFMIYGMRHLTQVLAIDSMTVSALVLPPPATPVVTSDLTCNPLNLAMTLTLDWEQDTGGGTFSYDITRNGLPLVSGLPNTMTTYTDTALTIATPYTYVIKANGPMGPGVVDSAPVTLTTPYNCNGLTQPTVSITQFRNRLIDSFEGIAFSYARRPKLIGTSNIPYARILIDINTETKLHSETTANINGYWEWLPPKRLEFERSIMYITAIDPLNANRYATTSLRYQIVRSGESEEQKDGDKKIEGSPQYVPSQEELIPKAEPEDFRFDFSASQETVRQGEKINLSLTPYVSRKEEENIPVEFQLIDQDGTALSTLTRNVFFRNGDAFQVGMEVPLYIKPGQYKLQATFVYDEVRYSKSVPLNIKAFPLLTLSSGREITYDEFMWNFGWIAFVLLTTLIVWLFFLFYEYWLYLRGRGHVDEFKVARLGYFSRL